MRYFVADLGTTNLKLALVSDDHQVIEAVEAKNMIQQDSSGKHESDPDATVQDLFKLLKTMTVKYPDVTHLVFSTQMHALLATDEAFNVMMPTMTWADLRAKEMANILHQEGDANQFFQISGTPIHPMNPFVKLLYLKNARPDLFDNSNVRFMDIKAYIIQRLTGKFVVDYATGSSMGLMDIKNWTWSEELLNHAQVSENQLPKLLESKASIPVQTGILDALGLPEDFTIILGSTDGALANLSTVVYEGQNEQQAISPFVFSFGTSAAVRYLTELPLINPTGALFTYIVDDTPHYIVGGPLNNAGNVLDWLYQEFGFKDAGMSFEKMLDDLYHHPFSQAGPFFMPFLNGERAPYWNAFLKAEFKEVSGSTKRMDLAKAVFEGVFFEARQVIDLVLQTSDQDVDYVQVNGKIFNNPLIFQWIANILGLPLEQVSSSDASIVGAGVILKQAINFEGADEVPQIARTTVVAEDALKHSYNIKYKQFKKQADHLNRYSQE